MDLFEFLELYMKAGLRDFFCTDVSKDGMLTGPATDLYRSLINAYPKLKLTASGGVSCMEDVNALLQVGCDGVIIGKAFYENRITIKEIKDFASQSTINK